MNKNNSNIRGGPTFTEGFRKRFLEPSLCWENCFGRWEIILAGGKFILGAGEIFLAGGKIFRQVDNYFFGRWKKSKFVGAGEFG